MADDIEKEEEIETDIIDDAIGAMVDELIGDEADDDEFDDISDMVFEIIEDLVDNEEIADIPAEDAPDEEKQEWIEKSLPILKQRVKEEEDGDPDLEQ